METDILGFDGMYTITKKGDIFSYKQKKKRKLKQQKASQSKKGYFQVRLFNEEFKKGKLFYVHRLMYETFVGEIPEDREIDHIDGDTSNNNIDNIQILSRRENINKWVGKVHKHNFREKRDVLIELYKEHGSYKEVAAVTGMTLSQVYRVIKDILHKRIKGKYVTARYNPELQDEFTDRDRRLSKWKN
jgi:DNA-directed RNA polymerase specialized sigma subunit